MGHRVLTFTSARGTITGQLSERRAGVTGPWGSPEPLMRLLTRDNVQTGDILSSSGSDYRVTAVHQVGDRTVCELVKEV